MGRTCVFCGHYGVNYPEVHCSVCGRVQPRDAASDAAGAGLLLIAAIVAVVLGAFLMPSIIVLWPASGFGDAFSTAVHSGWAWIGSVIFWIALIGTVFAFAHPELPDWRSFAILGPLFFAVCVLFFLPSVIYHWIAVSPSFGVAWRDSVVTFWGWIASVIFWGGILGIFAMIVAFTDDRTDEVDKKLTLDELQQKYTYSEGAAMYEKFHGTDDLWFVGPDEKLRGPYTSAKLKLFIAKSKISKDALVRKGKNGTPAPARSVTELASPPVT